MKSAVFNTVLEAFAEADSGGFSHPYLKKVQFILTDDRPNDNAQGIEYEDFPMIMASAINSPIKMYYQQVPKIKSNGKIDTAAGDVGGHAGSFTIGHISETSERTLDDGTHQIIANGVLYAEEFPNEIEYLQSSFAEGKAPGISWELRYKDSILKKGINWLKGAVTTAATFVKHPAYGTRTALLALASNQQLDEQHLIAELVALANSVNPTSIDDNKGGTAKVEEELKKALEELAAARAALEDLKKESDTLKATVASQGEVIAEYKKAAVAEERIKKMTEAGLALDPEKMETKKEFLVALTEEAFAEYISDLQTVMKTAASKKAEASRKSTEIPRLDSESLQPVSVTELKERMRVVRTTAPTEE